MTDDRQLDIWTIYDRPRDFPDCFVARCFTIGEGAIERAKYVITAPTLEEIREMIPWGLALLPRSPNDDPNIVESWI
jgi:hypothetical protein